MVNYAHIYDDGNISAHMYPHVYYKGVGKKCKNRDNLIFLEKIHLDVSSILYLIIILVKVITIPSWRWQRGSKEWIIWACQFYFPYCGHTQNAADRLFNLLKHNNCHFCRTDCSTNNYLHCMYLIPTQWRSWLLKRIHQQTRMNTSWKFVGVL